jgi:hypothetical protein
VIGDDAVALILTICVYGLAGGACLLALWVHSLTRHGQHKAPRPSVEALLRDAVDDYDGPPIPTRFLLIDPPAPVTPVRGLPTEPALKCPACGGFGFIPSCRTCGTVPVMIKPARARHINGVRR